MIPYVPAFAGSKPAGLTPGFQPTMVPSSVANKKTAGAEVAWLFASTPLILNPPSVPSVLNTVPVGVPLFPVGSPGDGILTTSELMLTGVLFRPGTRYRLATPALLSDTQR